MRLHSGTEAPVRHLYMTHALGFRAKYVSPNHSDIGKSRMKADGQQERPIAADLAGAEAPPSVGPSTSLYRMIRVGKGGRGRQLQCYRALLYPESCSCRPTETATGCRRAFAERCNCTSILAYICLMGADLRSAGFDVGIPRERRLCLIIFSYPL